MDNQARVIEEFLNNLHKTLKIVSLYPESHPSFRKCVEDFKSELEHALSSINPIKIGIAFDSLYVADMVFSKKIVYEELAQMMHMRRLKTLEFRKDFTLEELIFFFSKISLRPREIFRLGGVAKIFGQGVLPHISVEQLDYSQLLHAEGAAYNDMWLYLLKEATEEDNVQKASVVADNFAKIIKYFPVKDILQDNETKQNLQGFLNYIKGKKVDRFSFCSKKLAEHIIRNIYICQDVSPDAIGVFFDNLSENDIAEILSDELLYDDNFDQLSFNLFLKIISPDKHRAVSGFLDKALNRKGISDSQKIKTKIGRLFSNSEDSSTSQVYRKTLLKFLDDISYVETISLDRSLMLTNYRRILASLLLEEKDHRRITVILNHIENGLKDIAEDDFEYLKLLIHILQKKRAEDTSLADLFNRLDSQIVNFIEESIWKEEASLDIQPLLETLQSSTLGLEVYLYRIFKESKINPYVIKMFLRFFPDRLGLFYEHLKEKHSDVEFLERTIASLKKVDSPIILDVLKQIFLFSNKFIKLEIVKAMQELPMLDKDFLFEILKGEEIALKKEALIALARYDSSRHEALKELLFMPGIIPWDRRNKVLFENIIAVEEADIREAKDYLIDIKQRLFFWNRKLKNTINAILQKWIS
ncbi:MAG: hypothetical protein NC908_03595 [Candidatus Omnitrophica bacterium]|nr:hypothetical protein [Candidatus Omnitrophota bacterium]